MNVFVSSTFEDLKQHRVAVEEVLRRMKTQPSAMEFFGSRTDNAMSACYQEIDGCDFLIGIYAWRYGHQPDENSPSITEKEFDYALQRGKKCLCYVVNESYHWAPAMIDGGLRAERLAAFKAKVKQLFICCTFTTPDDLAKQVAADLARETGSASGQSLGLSFIIDEDRMLPKLQLFLNDQYQKARRNRQECVMDVTDSKHITEQDIQVLLGIFYESIRLGPSDHAARLMRWKS